MITTDIEKPNLGDVPRKLSDALNPKQLEAVLKTDGPVLVLAGPGSGKTRIITYRIIHLLDDENVAPENILAVTFTNKAAGEMKSRVNKLSPLKGRYVWISTFHSFSAQLLRMEAKNIGLSPGFVIYDETDQRSLIKECMKDLNIDDEKYPVGTIYDKIMRAKDDMLDADSFMINTMAMNDHLRYAIANVYAQYQKKLSQHNALDFGDLILKVIEAFRKNDALREKYQQRFVHLLVDEFQDTNRAQFVLIKMLTEKHKNVCVVGNDDQSIYSWRGANINNILDFDKEFKGARTIALEQNYRSTKKILDCAKRVIRNNIYRKDKDLFTKRKPGEDININIFMNEYEESRFVAGEIKRITREKNLTLNDFAVFYRTNAQSRVMEEVFIQENIPYNIVGTVRFYERMEVKDLLAYLRLIVNPEDHLSLKRIINVPHRHIGKTTLKALEDYSKEYNLSLWKTLFEADRLNIPDKARKSIKYFTGLIKNFQEEKEKLSIAELASLIIDKIALIEILQLEGTLEAKDRIDNIKEFVSAVSERKEPLEDFLASLSLTTHVDEWQQAAGNPRVTMMTLHLSKGLEFPVVFLTGLEEGLFPISSAVFGGDKNSLEEERRLCYVGITRAIDNLYMTCAETRRIYGQVRNNIPSRFLREAELNPVKITEEISTTEVMKKEKSRFRVGTRVNHPEFGAGRILKITGESEETMKVTVMFDNGQWKKLVYKYANLKKI